MFPEDQRVQKVQQAMFDPFEYLMLRHKKGLLKTDFTNSPGKVSYHVACHQRVQRIGMKTRELLELIEGTEVDVIERCSGHDGTYTFKKEFHDSAMKICRPVVNRVKKAEPDVYTSDCPMAGHHISMGLDDGSDSLHPITVVRQAYGL
jgi:Fe-S oxidoreductase